MADISQIPLPEQGIDAFLNQLKLNADLRNTNAQARKSEAQANLPFGGTIPPGPAGQVVGLQMVKMLYGENSPQYKQAEQAFNLSQQSTSSRMSYQDALRQSLPIRYTTPQGRSLEEQSNVGQGYSPSGTPRGQPVVPGAPGYKNPYNNNEEAANQYELHRLKQNVPATTLTSSLRGTNAEQTLNNINVDDLTHYSGVKGASDLLRDRAASLNGKPSEQFNKYQTALTNAKLLAKQYRQMMGDSVTPSNQEALDFITNPTSWVLHPDVAKQKFNTFADTLRRENKVFKSATGNPSVYTGVGDTTTQNTSPDNAEGKITATKNIDGNEYVMINNEWHRRKK